MNEEKARILGGAGYRRASLGVQDFDPDVQKLINRIQSFELTSDTSDYLRSSGFTSINFDLIYGLPGQTVERIADTTEKVIELRPERIALYGYAHVKWKVKVQHVFQKYGLPSPAERIDLFLTAAERLIQAGYKHIGLDHFALPEDELSRADGTLRRNFMGYTTVNGAGVLGIGVSSISDIDGVLYQNTPDINEYTELTAGHTLPVKKILIRNQDDKVRAAIIETLMCKGGTSALEISEKFPDVDVGTIFRHAADLLLDLERDGLVTVQEGTVTATDAGSYFLRNIACCFDAYFERHSKSDSPIFSRAI